MSKIVSPILCTIKFVTAPKTGQYGDYQSVLFITESGEEIWKSFNAGSPELEALTKGQKVELVPSGEKNGKVSHKVVLLSPAPSREDQAIADHHNRTLCIVKRFKSFLLKRTLQPVPELLGASISLKLLQKWEWLYWMIEAQAATYHYFHIY